MKKRLISQVTGILFGSVAYPAERAPKRLSLEYLSQCHKLSSRRSRNLKHNKLDRMSKIAETLTRKLSLGAKILKVGGLEKIFSYNFSVMEGEKLIKASQCYLSTTAGPIAGILFISTIRFPSAVRDIHRALLSIRQGPRNSLQGVDPYRKYVQSK